MRAKVVDVRSVALRRAIARFLVELRPLVEAEAIEALRIVERQLKARAEYSCAPRRNPRGKKATEASVPTKEAAEYSSDYSCAATHVATVDPDEPSPLEAFVELEIVAGDDLEEGVELELLVLEDGADEPEEGVELELLAETKREAATRRERERQVRRRARGRPPTIHPRNISRRELARERELNPTPDHVRPQTRGDCVGGARPCPFVSCAHHLYLDVDEANGSIKLVFPDLEPDELEESCALDIADRGGATLEEVGASLNVTRERTRQIEIKAFATMRRRARNIGLELEPEREVSRRRLPLLEDELEETG